MSIQSKSIRRILFPCLLAAVLFLAPGLASKPGQPTNGHVFSLQAPSFVGVARAEEGAIASVIEDEAGISAYFQAPTGINLDDVRDEFRTIETETSEYIIGSVPIFNYDITEDAHVYVHVDGWVLAYYLADDPVSNIFDWQSYDEETISSTKLQNVLAVMASAAGSPFPGATYYDFRYPNATNLMLVAKVSHGSFEIQLPSGFAYYDRSWSLASWWPYCSYCDCGAYYLDDVLIQCHYGGEPVISHGALTTGQMLPDTVHTIYVGGAKAYGGLAIVYRIP